ncbi:MAG: tRNA (guanosine(37)-N1)-methyltransferase TrmD [Bacillota bacterium]
MQIDIISAFPGSFSGVFDESMLRRAQEKELLQLRIIDLRDFSTDKHRRVDDAPYGGGAGMVMSAEPFFLAVEALGVKKEDPGTRIILLSPGGAIFNQGKAQELSALNHMVILCGHYEGVDERVALHLAQERISIGDFVLTGGEIPAMVLVDAVTRLIPGLLSNSSLAEESFTNGMLEYPQYTRPYNFRGMLVPDVLLSGNHGEIKHWRYRQSLERTRLYRPELFEKRQEAGDRSQESE